MDKVIVTIKAGGRSYCEEIDLKETREYFDELQSNGGNPHMAAITFEHWVRPISVLATQLAQFNERDENSHFIFGHYESVSQSESPPQNLFVYGDPVSVVVHWVEK